MSKSLRNIWQEVARPLSLHPQPVQFAALCTRIRDDRPEVLLITSRDTGRWIIPKGWPIDGLDGAGTAQQEAWEEAGVKAASVEPEPVGQFSYDKILKDGSARRVLTHIYRLHVAGLVDDFPEAGQRKRVWVRPQVAAERVQEPELRDVLLRL